jgi:hypothetical protein
MRRQSVIFAALMGLAAGARAADVDVSDRSVFQPTLRGAFEIGGSGAEAPSEPKSGHAIEFELTGAKGDATQNLFTGQTVRFAGQAFLGPQQIKHEFDFSFLDVAYRWRRFFGSGVVGIELLGGIGFLGYEHTMTGPTQQAKADLGSAGLVGGVGFLWRIRPTTSFQTRLTVYGSGKDDAVNGAARFEVMIVQALGRHAALKGGIAGWGLHAANERSTSNASDLRVGFGGPTLGLELMF